jgi:hypothetical protein
VPLNQGAGRDEARAAFGQVMGFVAITLGFLALGAYVGRDLSTASCSGRCWR